MNSFNRCPEGRIGDEILANNGHVYDKGVESAPKSSPLRSTQ